MNIHKRLRYLHRTGEITHAEWVVGDTLLWSCRPPGRVEFQVSYDRIAQLAHCARSTVATALAKLRKLGVLSWRSTWLRVLGRRVRWRNVYRFSESDQPATDSVHRDLRKRHRGGEQRLSFALLPPLRSVEEQLRLLRGG